MVIILEHVQGQTSQEQYKSLQCKGDRVSSGLAASNDTLKQTEHCGYTGMHVITTSYTTYMKLNVIQYNETS